MRVFANTIRKYEAYVCANMHSETRVNWFIDVASHVSTRRQLTCQSTNWHVSDTPSAQTEVVKCFLTVLTEKSDFKYFISIQIPFESYWCHVLLC